jgi:hypothetical protein
VGSVYMFNCRFSRQQNENERRGLRQEPKSLCSRFNKAGSNASGPQLPRALRQNEAQQVGDVRIRGLLFGVAVTFSLSKAKRKAKTVRPNNSLKLTRNGSALWLRTAHFVHHAARGHSALPLRAA